MSILLESGINILKALDNVKDNTNNKEFKKVIIKMKLDISKGKSLSEAMSKYEDLFSSLVINLVKVSERSGDLSLGFKYIVNYLNSEKNIKDKIKSALIYPIILLVITFLIILVMFLFIIPMYQDMFIKLNVNIPQYSKFVFNIVDFFKKYFIFIFTGLVFLIIFIIFYLKTKNGKRIFDKFKCKFLFFKKITELKIGSLFCRIIYILNSHGISFIDSLEVANENIGNEYVKSKLKTSIVNIKKGGEISSNLSNCEVLPNMLTEMLSVVYNNEQLGEILKVNYEFYEKELDSKMKKYIVFIEPIMILFISLIVVSVMISVFIPMFGLMDNIGGL